MARQKEEILFEWIEPKAAAIESARALKKKYNFTVFFRTFIISTVVLVVLYFVFDYLFPPNFPINLLGVFIKAWRVGIMIMVFGCLIYPWLSMFDRARYRITSRNIKILGAGHSPRILKWHNLKGYVLTESQTIPGQRDITLLTDGWSRIIHLPDDGLADQIIQYVAGRLPVFQTIPESACPVPLTFLQKCCFALCTVLYSGVVGYWFFFSGAHFFQKNINEFAPALLMALILLFGPGTICSIGMFGWSFFKNKWFRVRAILINFVGFSLLPLMMLFKMILLLWKMKKEGGW
jgi:hypothetical protein